MERPDPKEPARLHKTRSWDRLLASFVYRVRERVDRYNAERLLGSCECGPGCSLGRRATLTGGKAARLGENVHIGDGAFIRAEGGLTIGDNTHISRNLLLYTMDHRTDGERLPFDRARIYKPVAIGRNVWIGMNVVVAPGATIGDGAIIGMGTTVSGDVPPLAIIVGAGWRQVGSRDATVYDALDASGAYSATDGVAYLRPPS